MDSYSPAGAGPMDGTYYGASESPQSEQQPQQHHAQQQPQQQPQQLPYQHQHQQPLDMGPASESDEEPVAAPGLSPGQPSLGMGGAGSSHPLGQSGGGLVHFNEVIPQRAEAKRPAPMGYGGDYHHVVSPARPSAAETAAESKKRKRQATIARQDADRKKKTVDMFLRPSGQPEDPQTRRPVTDVLLLPVGSTRRRVAARQIKILEDLLQNGGQLEIPVDVRESFAQQAVLAAEAAQRPRLASPVALSSAAMGDASAEDTSTLASAEDLATAAASPRSCPPLVDAPAVATGAAGGDSATAAAAGVAPPPATAIKLEAGTANPSVDMSLAAAAKSEEGAGVASPVKEEPPLTLARAISDWESDEKDDLSFRKGDVIHVTNRWLPGGGWGTGSNGEGGCSGWFPVNFVEEISNDDEAEELITEMQHDMEADETSFMKALGLKKTTLRPRPPPRPQKPRPPARYAIGDSVLVNWSGQLTLAKVLKKEFDRKAIAKDDWSYFVHFEKWQKSHDTWMPTSHLMAYASTAAESEEEKEPAAAAAEPGMEDSEGGVSAAADETEPPMDEWDQNMAAEEDGNQWLYSCIVCGDGGDIVMCDACPRVYHTACIGNAKVGRGAWYCPLCVEGKRVQSRKKQRPAIAAHAAAAELLEIEELCLSLPVGHFLSAAGTQLSESRKTLEKCTKEEIGLGPEALPRLRDLASWQRLLKAKLVEKEEAEMDSKKIRSRIVKKRLHEDQSQDALVTYFHENGICHFESALSTDQVELAVNAVEDRCNHVIHVVNTMSLQRVLETVGFTTFKLRHVGRYDMVVPAFDTKEYLFLDKEANWMPAVRAILGEDCDCIYKGVMLSMPGSLAQPWHQDGPHLTEKRHMGPHCLNVFVPLVDLSMANGPTEFVPTTHMLGDFDRPGNPLAVCASAGDAVFMDYRIKHRGLGNNSTTPRPLLYITYAKKGWTDRANFSSRRYRELPQLADGSMSRKKDRREQRLEAEHKLHSDEGWGIAAEFSGGILTAKWTAPKMILEVKVGLALQGKDAYETKRKKGPLNSGAFEFNEAVLLRRFAGKGPCVVALWDDQNPVPVTSSRPFVLASKEGGGELVFEECT